MLTTTTQPQPRARLATLQEREDITTATHYATNIVFRAATMADYSAINFSTGIQIRRNPARAALILQAVDDRTEMLGRKVSWVEVDAMIAEEEGMLQ